MELRISPEADTPLRRAALYLALALLAACSPIGFTPVAYAQAAKSSALQDLARIQEEGLKRSQLMESLSWLTDVYGGRLTNSPSQVKAAEWIGKRLRFWGIDRTWRENWGPFGQGWTNEVLWVRAVAPEPFPIIANIEAWTPGTDGVVRGPAVLVTDLESEADLARYRGKLKNAFIFVSAPPEIEPPNFEPLAKRHTAKQLVEATWPHRREPQQARSPADSARIAKIQADWKARQRIRALGLDFFAEEGAAAVVVAGRGTGGTIFLDMTYLGSFGARAPAPLPVLTFASEHYGRIVRILEKGLPVTLEASVVNTFHGSSRDSAFNVLAELPGTDRKDEVVMLGAHLDGFHFATGATDNAANVATMMEAMRILQATGVPLRRTVRLGLWTGEEQGLYGSKAYVHRHFVDSLTNSRKPAFDKFAAYYNLDNGGGAIRGAMADWEIQPNMVVDSTFRAWTAMLAPELGLEIVAARGGGGTDHVSFYTKGLPGFQFMQDWLEYSTRTHHTNMDTYERVVPDDVRRNAVIVASFVYLTANQDQLFPRTLLPRRLNP